MANEGRDVSTVSVPSDATTQRRTGEGERTVKEIRIQVLAEETVVLAEAMLKLREHDGWKYALSLNQVPEIVGSYAVYDGLQLCGFGTSWNLRKSARDCSWTSTAERPIILWKPDTDGSAALWLDGKIRCSRCQMVIEVDDESKHARDVHEEEIEDDE